MADWLQLDSWQISSIDIGVIVGYLVLMILVGWICKGISKDVSDYVRMGCKSTWWLMGTSIFMLMTSAGTFTGGSGQAYYSGWSFILMSFSGFFGYMIMAAFFAPWMRRTRAITPTDTIRMRYGPIVEQFNAYLGQLSGMVWGGVWLLALANFLAVVFHIPIPVVIVFVGIVVVFYSVSGGSWSVQVTDTLQAYILVPIAMVVLFLSLKAVGGIDGLLEGIKSQGLEADYAVVMEPDHEYSTAGAKVGAGYFTMGWIFASLIYRFLLAANMTACWRFLSCKSDADARKAAVLAGCLLFFGSFLWYVPAMVGRILYEEDIALLAKPIDSETAAAVGAEANTSLKLNNAADGAYAIVAKKVLPPGLLGLVVIGLFAATMSSLDSALTGNAGIITNNLYPPLMRLFGKTPWTGMKLLRLTQVINLLLGAWAICLALMLWKYSEGKSIYEVGLNFIGLISAPMVSSMVLSFFVRRLPWWSPLVGMTTGLGLSLLMTTTGFLEGWVWHERIFISVAVTIIPTFLTSFFWFTADEVHRKRVDEFFLKLRTPVDFEKEVGESADHTIMKMIGGLGLLMAAGIGSLIFFAQDATGRWAVAFVMSCIALISTIMLAMGLRADRAKADVAVQVEPVEMRDAADD